MANLILPDPRMEMPELLEPGRKPVGPVEIDRGHPLARGLVGCYLFRPNHGAVDLVSGEVTPLHSSMTIGPSGLDLTNHTNVTDLPAPILGTEFTFHVEARKTTGTFESLKVLFSYREGTGTNDTFIFYPWDTNNGSGIRAYYDNAARLNQNSGAAHGDTDWHSFTLTGDDGTSSCNGRIDTKLVAGIPSVLQAMTATPTAISLGGWYGTQQLCNDIYVKHFYVYDRNLRSTEIDSLHQSPYQFLIPA